MRILRAVAVAIIFANVNIIIIIIIITVVVIDDASKVAVCKMRIDTGTRWVPTSALMVEATAATVAQATTARTANTWAYTTGATVAAVPSASITIAVVIIIIIDKVMISLNIGDVRVEMVLMEMVVWLLRVHCCMLMVMMKVMGLA